MFVLRSTFLFHMMSFVQFPVILSKIIQQHGTYRFDEFKQATHRARIVEKCPFTFVVSNYRPNSQTITDMLETYHYEMAILSTANHLLSTDTFKSMRAYVRRRCKGVRVSLPSDVSAASVEVLEVMPSGNVVVQVERPCSFPCVDLMPSDAQPIVSATSSSLNATAPAPSAPSALPNDRAVKRQLARYSKFYRTVRVRLLFALSA